jgi:probable phosphoglycerate mutase
LLLVRHGETEWSSSGKHTGLTDIPLTSLGEHQADELAAMVATYEVDRVLCSPLVRAVETCKRAGLLEQAEIVDAAVEWDYGVYEGIKTSETRQDIPDWSVWTHEIFEGESLEEVGARADLIIASALESSGTTAVFAHGHFLRIVGARWIGLPPSGGQHLVLDASSVCLLGHERETRAIRQWNETCHLRGVDHDM